MGRGNKRKTQRELRRLANMEPGRPMGRGALEHHWNHGDCAHPAPTATMYGLCAMLSCNECGKSMQFILRFGRTKTMDVSMYDDPNNSSARPVGRATLEGSRDMIHSHATSVFMPEDGADPNGGSPERDKVMLGILMDALTTPGGMPEGPPGDFVAAWRKLDCPHENTSCQVFGRLVSLECRDCAADLTFEYIGKNRFNVRLARMPLEPAKYGTHYAKNVVRALREFAEIIELPMTMADKMSDDPDRDARRLAGVVLTLEKHGLFRRVHVPDHPNLRIIETVSALSCNRPKFNDWLGPLASELRRKKVKITAYGKPISAENYLEAARLAWPCVFEGVGIVRDAYDLTGASEHCVKCGFSTLDDNDAGPDHWERGCPECGYPGYLIGLDG